MIRLGIGVFFIVLPFLELILLVKLTHALGFLWTLTLMVASAAAGGMVLARQSAASFRQALEAASRGETPQDAVLDGMFLMLAGILLVIPGLLTDALAVLLLIPPVRRWIAQQTMRGLIVTASGPDPYAEAEPAARTNPRRDPFREPASPPREGPVIEGEFQRLDERTPGSGPERR